MVCPKGWCKALLSVIWEDDIRPILTKMLIIFVYVFMGMVMGTIVVLFTLLLYKLTTMF